MAKSLPTVVANTDERWFSHFRRTDKLAEFDEVNFWRPAAQGEFRALSPGEPLFFRLKAPHNAIRRVRVLRDLLSYAGPARLGDIR